MAKLLFSKIISTIHPHVLPHEKNGWRANLLKSPSLLAYIVFLVGLTVIFNTISIVKPGILGFASNISKEEVFTQTNTQRTALNLSSLSENNLLSIAAQQKADDMFSKNYWAHVAPDGTTPWDFIKKNGYNYSSAGENLARDFNDSQSVVSAWMASKSHRENIVNSHYKEIGIGVVNGILDGKETTLVVQMFGTPVSTFLAQGQSQIEPAAQTTTPAVAGQITPTPTAAPKAQNTPTPTTAISMPTPIEQLPAAVSFAQLKPASQPRYYLNSFQVFRGISLGLVAMLTALIIADLIVARKTRLVRTVSHGFAHLGILFILFLAIWYTNSGLIL